MIWIEVPGSANVTPLSYSGDYTISHRFDEHTLSYRPTGQHVHVGTWRTSKEAKIGAEHHARVGERKIFEATKHGDRACYIRRVIPKGDLWEVSLDGEAGDAIVATEAEAERVARKMLHNPDCPCWVEP